MWAMLYRFIFMVSMLFDRLTDSWLYLYIRDLREHEFKYGEYIWDRTNIGA